MTLRIIKNAVGELKRLSQNGFQECMQHFYSRWLERIIAKGDYFLENIAYMIARFCISQK